MSVAHSLLIRSTPDEPPGVPAADLTSRGGSCDHTLQISAL